MPLTLPGLGEINYDRALNSAAEQIKKEPFTLPLNQLRQIPSLCRRTDTDRVLYSAAEPITTEPITLPGQGGTYYD